MMTDLEVLLLLNYIPNCDARGVRLLLDAVGEVRDIVSDDNLEFISKTSNFGGRFVKSIRDGLKKFDVKKEISELEKQSINVISFLDENYPADLLEIHDPPVLLYVKGDMTPSDDYCLSIVGSRNASFYGLEMAEGLAFDLASRGITIVSGMAQGIDSSAHQGALRGGGRTIAVLGSGVDVIYPPDNKKLYESIVRHGAVVSEFPLKTKPFSYNFPKRNRIISGISKGTVVVEAAKRSGSLITARLALEQGREVYSVPGKADSVRSQGTNNLIKEGARLITSADEIIEELFPDMLEGNSVVHNESRRFDSKGEKKLNTLEHKVMSCLSSKPMHADQIAGYTDISVAKIYSVLTHLEVIHKVKKSFGGGYVREKEKV